MLFLQTTNGGRENESTSNGKVYSTKKKREKLRPEGGKVASKEQFHTGRTELYKLCLHFFHFSTSVPIIHFIWVTINFVFWGKMYKKN